MKKITALGVCMALAAVSELSATPWFGKSRALKEENGIVKNAGNSPQVIKVPQKIQDNWRITIPVRLPKRGEMSISTGRGKEKLRLVNNGDNFLWQHYSVTGEEPHIRSYPNDPFPVKMRYHWENTTYAPNGRYSQNFSLDPVVLDWNAFFLGKFFRDTEKTFFPLSIEVENGRIRWYFDNILLQEQPVSADIAGRQLSMIVTRNVEMKTPEVTALVPAGKFFHTVNLANKYNTKGTNPITRGNRFTFEGIPFEAAGANELGNDCVDLGVSWFKEGNSTGYEEPHKGTSGGRWGGVLSGNHTRLQFRIPNRQFNAIYILASCENRPDRINRLTAQFYRPGSGFPVNFTPAETIKTDGKLQLIKIPFSPDKMGSFMDREVIEMELTGDVHLFRAYPDPNYYSFHGAGVPSGVQVYAVTLGIADLEVKFMPESLFNLWVDGNPSYSVTLTNGQDKEIDAELKLNTESYDKEEHHKRSAKIKVPANGSTVYRFDLPLAKYGWHKLDLTVNGVPYTHTLTRIQKREYKARKFDTKGFMFGSWPARSGMHFSPSPRTSISHTARLGIETFSFATDILNNMYHADLMKKYGMKNFMSSYINCRSWTLDTPDIEQKLWETRMPVNQYSEPSFMYVFAEPGGIGAGGSLPEFYGEPRLKRTPAEEERYKHFKRIVLNFGKAFRKLFPGQKILLPWGQPQFAIPFLEDPETRDYIDGYGLDIGFFDRLPEMQFHGSTLHGVWQFMHYWKKYKKEKPLIVTVEGPCIGGVKEGALTAEQHAAHSIRIMLILSTYGINRFFSTIGAGPSNSSYWGEQHYAGGGSTRHKNDPYLIVGAQATLIRHLRYMEFVKWIPTGSLSTYCVQYKDSRNGAIMYAIWTVRGKREVQMKFTRAFDIMDNPIRKLVATQMPIFVYSKSEEIKFGTPDNSDIKLGSNLLKLGNVKDLFTRQILDTDLEYTDSSPGSIRRFPATMELKKSSDGLEITLPPQKVDRGIMPYYTTLIPEKPIAIPGKGRYITMEVNAASDWGRIVYVLRDAKGEKWVSVGQRRSYNCDDTPNDSFFNFDGKRLIRFELPAHLYWDRFRERGTTWWCSSEGDGFVDLPLSIEKIFIERRNKAMYLNDLVKVDNPTVTLGDLYIEYADKADMKNFDTRSMPKPPATAKLFNPIAMMMDNPLPPSEIEKVSEPIYQYDGTRGNFHFKEMPGAVAYDIWLSRTPDGANALCLGKNIKKSGALVKGFIAHVDFYAFVVYRDKNGNASKPSAPFKLNMQDKFAEK